MYYRFLLICGLLYLNFNASYLANVESPQSTNPNYLLGQQFFLKGDSKKAKKYFVRALTANPDHVASHYALAKINFLEKNFLEAFELFRHTLSLQKDYEDSSALFKQVLDILKAQYQPDTRDPKRVSAQIYLDLKSDKIDYAKNRIDWLTKNYPDFAMGWDHLANYYYRLGNFDQSLIYLKQALSLDPTNPTIFSHYESTYILKNHKLLPEQQRALLKKNINKQESQIENQIIDQFIADELKKQELRASANLDLSDSNETQQAIPIQSANDQKFFNKLLSKQVGSLPTPPKTKPKTIKKQPAKKLVKYQPIPERQTSNRDEQKILISRAESAYNDKNWEVAATAYGILFENNPNNKTFQDKFENAKRFDQFERKFLKARKLIQRGLRNSANYAKAIEEFNKLDTVVYHKLYKKSSFDDYLASIAFTQKNYKEAENRYEAWLRHEPQDVNSFYYLLLSQDAQDKYEEALQTYLKAKEIDQNKILGLPGVNKLRIKLYLIKYWWILLAIVLIWGLITVGYTAIKVKIRKDKSDRKQMFQQLRNLAVDEQWPELIHKIDQILMQEHTPAENYNLQYMKANAYLQSSQLEPAIRIVKSLLIKHKKDQQTVLLQARIFLAMEKTDEDALEPYRLLVIKDPGNLELLKILLKTLKSLSIYTQETKDIALQILEIESYNKQTLKDLTEIYINSEEYNQQSCEIMRRYLEMQSNETLVMLHYLKALVVTENFIESIRVGKRLIDINPDIEESHRLLIQAYDKLNMRDEMQSYYHQLSLDFSSSKVIQQMYSLVESNFKSSGLDRSQITNQGELEITEIAFQEGLALLEKSAFKDATLKFQTAASDPRFHLRSQLLSAKANLLLNDFDSARFYFDKLNLQEHKLDNEALEVIYLMAEFYSNNQNQNRALQLYQLIAKNDITFKDTFQKIELISINLK